MGWIRVMREGGMREEWMRGRKREKTVNHSSTLSTSILTQESRLD